MKITSRLVPGVISAWLLLSGAGAAVTVSITLDYRIPCDAETRTMTLGEINVTPHNEAADKWMEASFSVSSAVQPGKPGSAGIWQCMELHWLQTIWRDLDPPDRPTFGDGMTWDPPIIDPPNGGWDPPAQPHGDDNQPWYLNAAEEARENQVGVSYRFSDNAYDPPDPLYLGFSTYLVAVPTKFCEDAPSECLMPGEILVLGGFDWTNSDAEANVLGTPFNGGTVGDVAEINTALGTALFPGWTAVRDKQVCCGGRVPDFGPSLLLFAISLLPVVLMRHLGRKSA